MLQLRTTNNEKIAIDPIAIVAISEALRGKDKEFKGCCVYAGCHQLHISNPFIETYEAWQDALYINENPDEPAIGHANDTTNATDFPIGGTTDDEEK
jgi:hypothetical protein